MSPSGSARCTNSTLLSGLGFVCSKSGGTPSRASTSPSEASPYTVPAPSAVLARAGARTPQLVRDPPDLGVVVGEARAADGLRTDDDRAGRDQLADAAQHRAATSAARAGRAPARGTACRSSRPAAPRPPRRRAAARPRSRSRSRSRPAPAEPGGRRAPSGSCPPRSSRGRRRRSGPAAGGTTQRAR